MVPNRFNLNEHCRNLVARRDFLKALPAAVCMTSSADAWSQGSTGVHFSVLEFDRTRILSAANAALAQPPLSLASAAHSATQTAEGFELTSVPVPLFIPTSEEKSSGALAQVDLLNEMVARVAAVTAAWRLTRERRFFDTALRQMRVWCLDPQTRMAPTLEQVGTLGAQQGDQRVNGICRSVALSEFARASALLCAAPDMPIEVDAGLRAWFAALLTWLNESKRGIVAREAGELQAICWTMQAAEFARFTRNDILLRECAHRFRDKPLRQMSLDGNFPPALHTRRPYAASMFTLECLGSACESLSTPFESPWNDTLPDGRGMRAAVAWAATYLANKGKWPYLADTHLFREQPLRCNALLFAGRAWNRMDYVEIWKQLRAETTNAELLEEHPITQPGLWAMRPPT